MDQEMKMLGANSEIQEIQVFYFLIKLPFLSICLIFVLFQGRSNNNEEKLKVIVKH